MKRRYQAGISSWTVLAWLYVVISVGMMASKIAPAFIDDMTIKKAVESINREGNLKGMGIEQVRNRLLQIFDINAVRDFDPKKLVLKQQEKSFLLDIDYEVRVNFYRNIDAVMSFKHHYELGAE